MVLKVVLIKKNKEEVNIKIGEVIMARSGEILKSTLGSCVGIIFYWPEKNRGALAHCLLPEAPAPSSQIAAKYVSQAIPSLMFLMKISAEDISQIKVWVSGGANMMEQLSKRSAQNIGLQNLEKAKSLLSEFGFKFKEIGTGGDVGRRIYLDSETGEVWCVDLVKAEQSA